MTYYIGTGRTFRKGTILVGRPPQHDDADSLETEEAFEEYRPPAALSRLESVYMVTTPDPDLIERAGAASAKHVYEVEPIGPVVRNDVGWWPVVYDWRAEPEVARQSAESYFDGEPCATEAPGVPDLWEYRAKALRIVRKVSVRRQNPLPLLAGLAGLFAVFPVTPVAIGIEALREKNRKTSKGVRK
jgi:hypothetical protein